MADSDDKRIDGTNEAQFVSKQGLTTLSCQRFTVDWVGAMDESWAVRRTRGGHLAWIHVDEGGRARQSSRPQRRQSNDRFSGGSRRAGLPDYRGRVQESADVDRWATRAPNDLAGRGGVFAGAAPPVNLAGLNYDGPAPVRSPRHPSNRQPTKELQRISRYIQAKLRRGVGVTDRLRFIIPADEPTPQESEIMATLGDIAQKSTPRVSWPRP
jgi:hypothetical protein